MAAGVCKLTAYFSTCSDVIADDFTDLKCSNVSATENGINGNNSKL